MGVTEPLKLFVCNIRKYFRMQYWKVLSYAILESTFFGHQPLSSVSHLRCINFCFASARCINFYRHFWDVFGGVGQHVTL